MPSADALRVNIRLRSGHYRWSLRLTKWAVWMFRRNETLARALLFAAELVTRRGLEVGR